MIPSIMDLFRHVLTSWQDDRLSENSRKLEEELGNEGFTVMLDNAYITGSAVTIGATTYVQMVGDIVLYCHELRTPRVVARELAFPFRENKDCHDEMGDISPCVQSSVLPDAKDVTWDVELQELMQEHRRQGETNS